MRSLVVAAIAAFPLTAFGAPNGRQVTAVGPTFGGDAPAQHQPSDEVMEFTLGMTQLMAPGRSFATSTQSASEIMGVTGADAESFHFLVAGLDADGNVAVQCVQGQTEAAQAETAAAAPTILRLRVRRPTVAVLETE